MRGAYSGRTAGRGSDSRGSTTSEPAPAPDEIRVWLVSLDVTPERRAFLEGLLSADERERAGRYLFAAPRDRYVVARGTLREILGRTTGLAPDGLRFSYPCVCGRPDCPPSRRKPRLDLGPASPPLRFNLAHTDGLAAIAVALGSEVGIDLERVDPSTAIGPAAERAFGADDLAVLRALPPAQQVEAFYRGWTRREAYVKARGADLDAGPEEDAGWSFHALEAPAPFVGTLAVERDDCTVSTRWWILGQ
jgi:4'-phosphopantetheinyl transferase